MYMQDQYGVASIAVDAKEGARLLSVSLRQFHNLRKIDGFPAPRLLAARSPRWLRSELEAFLVNMPRSLSDEPAQLAAARAAKAAGQPIHPAPFGAAHVGA